MYGGLLNRDTVLEQSSILWYAKNYLFCLVSRCVKCLKFCESILAFLYVLSSPLPPESSHFPQQKILCGQNKEWLFFRYLKNAFGYILITQGLQFFICQSFSN